MSVESNDIPEEVPTDFQEEINLGTVRIGRPTFMWVSQQPYYAGVGAMGNFTTQEGDWDNRSTTKKFVGNSVLVYTTTRVDELFNRMTEELDRLRAEIHSLKEGKQ